MNFLLPQGIGDSVWALLKVQSIAAGDTINIFIACWNKNNSAESRALEFISRFKFVDSVQMYEMPLNGSQAGCVLLPGDPADKDGFYRYIPDGQTTLPGIDFVLIPNAALERGIRIEDWLPEYKVNWQIMDDFQLEEIYVEKDYVVFFMASADSNTVSGHNRNGLWTPTDWVAFGKFIWKELGCRIVVVGADYDHSYFNDSIKPLVDDQWVDLIGTLSIGQTYSVIKKARFIISYQSGIGIVANYMGVLAGIFWRAKGDSISPHHYISFEEKMAEAWVNPAMIEQGKYLPLIYGRHGVDYITSEIKKRAW